jgi:hypothetical protein
MPITTILISGPARSGKTTLAHTLAGRALDGSPPHLIRLVRNANCVGPVVVEASGPRNPALRGNWSVPYSQDLAFELVPQAIHQVRSGEKFVTMLLEADADPALRYAYTYTHRIFVLRAPRDVRDVFRTSNQAALALRDVLDDTAAFASEIFGLFGQDVLDESEGVRTMRQEMPSGSVEKHVEVSGAQMRRFLNSPLGAEIATRIHLQPLYHPIVDSDIVVINAAGGGDAAVVEQLLEMLRTLFGRIREGTGRHYDLFTCDPSSADDPCTQQLIVRLRELLSICPDSD